jgi:hypothetical protein
MMIARRQVGSALAPIRVAVQVGLRLWIVLATITSVEELEDVLGRHRKDHYRVRCLEPATVKKRE